jgi:hypothetical protein
MYFHPLYQVLLFLKATRFFCRILALLSNCEIGASRTVVSVLFFAGVMYIDIRPV